MESNPLPNPSLSSTNEAPLTVAADVLVVGLFGDGKLPPTLAAIDQASNGWVSRLVNSEQIRGKQGELSLLASPLDSGPTMFLVVGLGDQPATRTLAFESGAAAIRKLSDRIRTQILVALPESFPPSMHDAIVAGTMSGCEGQCIYRSESSIHVPESVQFLAASDEAVQRGSVLGHSINHTRRLVNEPPVVLYPESFATMAEQIADTAGLSIEIWDEPKLEAEGCRALLAVGAGSSRASRLVILRHNGGGDEAPIAVVGKGVTFDSGGLSLKPSEGMKDMKCDMAGAATVVGVMHAVAQLGIKQNVIGFCGLAENMVSGDSYKLGDVIETRSGKTIEILNTDAEGRVVLADTLDVAIGHQPRAMVDLATLTGACMVALGTEVAGLMTNDQTVCDAIDTAAEEEGEPVWQLPMFGLYDDKVKSKVADIKNIGEGRWGGAITAAKFLENFVGDTPWVHIDIAGPAFADSPQPHRDAGATGAMVRTLVRWIESQ
ncbi:MAG: leucyl aminopeptidase [Rubripirellula sp.]